MLMNSNCNNRIKPFEAFLGGNILGMKFKVLTESGKKPLSYYREMQIIHCHTCHFRFGFEQIFYLLDYSRSLRHHILAFSKCHRERALCK